MSRQPFQPSAPTASAEGFSHAVFKTLRESNAHLERFALLGDNFALAIWRRETNVEETSYVQPGHHTLSYYIGGGYRTEREDQPGNYGAPRLFCTLPDYHESHWLVRDKMHFLHLYFLPDHFTRRAVIELDREPRELLLADRTYFAHPQMGQLCETLINTPWHGPDAQLHANDLAHTLLSELLRSQAVLRNQRPMRGGLAPTLRRCLTEYIDAHLDQMLTLGELATIACLSEYHLARMFRLSFGMPPYAWIAMRRIERAQQMLRTTALPLQQVADACGYADLSHFSHRFRTATGVAPSNYRKTLA